MRFCAVTNEQQQTNHAARALLWRAEVFSIADVSVLLDLPKATIELLIGRGQGPRVFLLGRRRYVLKSELHEWFTRMQAVQRTNKPASPPKLGQRGKARKAANEPVTE